MGSELFCTAGIGSVLGGLIVTQFGFDGVFVAMSVLAFMAAVYIATLNKEVLA